MHFQQLRKNRIFSSHPLLCIREAKNRNDND
nr:MAG TPA: Poxvirus protein F15 [Caudoviricetes sp.]DAQ27726.1 MAG TPA: Poxvirus protein F15 [Caudoviricetes sp.]DAT71785.1 MAG TPA: Poxvirus protein F15 [Caudoviricetes sp.]DAT92196.1 MAG TPA: Poxvirus protein F15 [Caudoviricetes sp.]